MTPYGYKIVRGKAVIDPEKAEQVRMFFYRYLQGLSIAGAARESGIELCAESARLMLGKGVYTGDDYYPAIISKHTFIRAGQEQEKRRKETKRGAAARPGEAAPVKTRFKVCFPRMKDPDFPGEAEKDGEHGHTVHASDKAALLYSFIRPAADGDQTISPEDRERIRECMEAHTQDRSSGICVKAPQQIRGEKERRNTLCR